ncbi:MAG TPA: histidine kinase [Candidatus Dormibacteraeota bacterium]|nr:histidine kinase [Candidatus Dormibacteraeota bacterium]
MSWLAVVLVEAALTTLAAASVFLLLRRRHLVFNTVEERATLRTLAFATSAVSTLRQGLTAKTAIKVLRSLVPQSGGPAAALYDSRGLLGFQAATGSRADQHSRHVSIEAEEVLSALASGRTQLVRLHADEPSPSCPLRVAVVAPLTVDEQPVAALATYHAAEPSPAQLSVATDLADLLATQLRLQRADQQQAALVRSELRALRAQISPHFIYNTLTTITSFVRTDPDRARDLLTEFADFSRRAFRGPAQEFTTLADELVYVNQYLKFEQARFGDRLTVRYHIDPEVLSTVVPALLIQPLVENAVKHGIEPRLGKGQITIEADDQDDECLILVRDDGEGLANPLDLSEHPGALGNIDRRLSHVFGPAHGLEITSEAGKGTSVRVRIPKYRPGVKAS